MMNALFSQSLHSEYEHKVNLVIYLFSVGTYLNHCKLSKNATYCIGKAINSIQ